MPTSLKSYACGGIAYTPDGFLPAGVDGDVELIATYVESSMEAYIGGQFAGEVDGKTYSDMED